MYRVNSYCPKCGGLLIGHFEPGSGTPIYVYNCPHCNWSSKDTKIITDNKTNISNNSMKNGG